MPDDAREAILSELKRQAETDGVLTLEQDGEELKVEGRIDLDALAACLVRALQQA